MSKDIEQRFLGRAWLFRGLGGTREIGSRTLLRRGQGRGQAGRRFRLIIS
jgi:hypothetical protein